MLDPIVSSLVEDPVGAAAKQVLGMGQRGEDLIVEALSCLDFDDWRHGWILSLLGDAEGSRGEAVLREALERVLDHGTADNRWAASLALAKRAREQSEVLLLEAYWQADLSEKDVIVECLSVFGGSSGLDVLEDVCKVVTGIRRPKNPFRVPLLRHGVVYSARLNRDGSLPASLRVLLLETVRTATTAGSDFQDWLAGFWPALLVAPTPEPPPMFRILAESSLWLGNGGDGELNTRHLSWLVKGLESLGNDVAAGAIDELRGGSSCHMRAPLDRSAVEYYCRVDRQLRFGDGVASQALTCDHCGGSISWSDREFTAP